MRRIKLYAMLFFVILAVSGCATASKNFKSFGASASNGGPLGVLVGAVAYGTGTLIEKVQEESQNNETPEVDFED